MKKLTMQQRRDRVGWLFVLPWFIGLVLFFIQPVMQLVLFSFTNFSLNPEGYSLLPLESGILQNYRDVLFSDIHFPTRFVTSFTDLLYQTPIIVFFSLFSAILLNRRTRGNTLVRTIFFLPIITTSSVVANIIQADVAQIPMASSSGTSSMFDISLLVDFLLESGFPQQVVDVVSSVVANVSGLIWSSSVQILIFLIALLSIPQVYYEVANVEGATAWVTFWKVTFPMISPFVLATTVYTVIDSFTSYSNPVIRYIMDYAVRDIKYSYSAAMAWLYFLSIALLLLVVFLLFRNMVFYGNQDRPAKGRRKS